MAGEINRVPWGLLSILDMQARGQAPRELAGQVSGSIDLLQLYMLQNRESRTGGAGPTAAVGGYFDNSAPQQLLVPQGELWWVWDYSIRPTAALVGAAIEVQIVPYVRRDNSRGFVLDTGIANEYTVGDEPVTSCGGFWMKANDVLGLRVVHWVAGTVDPTWILEASVTRFRV